MTFARSEDAVRFRKELAQLVREVRAIRRSARSRQEMAEEIGRTLSAAGSLGSYVTFTAGPGRTDGAPRVDHRKLDAVSGRLRAAPGEPSTSAA